MTQASQALEKESHLWQGKYQEEKRLRVQTQEDRQDLQERCERQREMMKDTARELIDMQS